MKRFNFRLQRVLDFKEQIEGQKRQSLADRLGELVEEKQTLIKLMSRKEQYLKKYASLFAGKLDVPSLKTTLSYIDRVKSQIIRQARTVVNAETQVEKARIEVGDAMRDRKKYEKLRERKHSEYAFQLNREEQKELDELAAIRHPASVGG